MVDRQMFMGEDSDELNRGAMIVLCVTVVYIYVRSNCPDNKAFRLEMGVEYTTFFRGITQSSPSFCPR